MRLPVILLTTMFAAAMWPAAASLAQKGGEEESGPYEPVLNWPAPWTPAGWVPASQAGVFVESTNRIFVLSRGEIKLPEKLPPAFNGSYGSIAQATTAKPEIRNCILVVDANGKLLEKWSQHDHVFAGGRGPHQIKISPHDPERHVWVVDDVRNQVFKFSNDGKKLVMTLGVAGVEGNDETHFGRPTDIAWLPDGTFFVTDGYMNTRVVKFDANGKFLKAWGTRGKGPGQFDTVHGIAIDRNRRLYVVDRANSRIQIFDENGKYLDEWPNLRSINAIMMTADQHLWAADNVTNKILKYDLNGRLLYSWGTQGIFPGAMWGVHQFSVDSAGSLYLAEAYNARVQKLRPRPGQEPWKLVGAPQALRSR
jgi:DNA-binding beta-propeller fold protein YncE